MKINKNSDPNEVFEFIRKKIIEIAEGVKNLPKEDRAEVIAEFENTILQAYKVKFGFKLDALAAKQPNLSMKEVLVQMLDLLPTDVNDAHVPVLTAYVFDNWKTTPQRLTA